MPKKTFNEKTATPIQALMALAAGCMMILLFTAAYVPDAGSHTEYTNGVSVDTPVLTAVGWHKGTNQIIAISALNPLPVSNAGTLSATLLTNGLAQENHQKNGTNILTAIEADTTTIAGAVSGSEMQVDVITMPTVTVNTHAVTQSGTWTVQPGNTANTTPWLMRLHDGTDASDILDLSNSNPLVTAIVDGNGDQITSFGGGTQYTNGQPVAIPTMTMMGWHKGTNSAIPVSVINPMPTTNMGTIGVTQSGTWDEVGINDSGNSITVDGTITAELSATDNAVLDTIASPVATISSTPLQRVAIFDSSDAQITSFGGGTQYTNGQPVAVPTMTMMAWHQGTNQAKSVSVQAPMPTTNIGTTAVSGTVAATQSGTWDEVGINDSGNSITVDATDLDVQIGGSDSLTIGTFPDNEPFNVAQWGGNAVTGGSGTIAAGSPRVTIATDDPVNDAAVELAAAIDTEVQVDVVGALPAGNNNIGDVDVASIAAGNNNIGDVDVASIAAGDNNIGNVDLASAIPAGDNDIGNVDLEFAGSAAATGSGAAGSTVLRSVTATDSPDVAALQAMTNGATAFTFVTTGAVATNVVKTSAGTLYSVAAWNTTGTDYWILLYNKAGTPATNDTVWKRVYLPANTNGAGNNRILGLPGTVFDTGIGYAVAETPTATNAFPSMTSGTVGFDLDYK